MTSPRPLDPPFDGAPFLVSDAVSASISRKRLRAGDLQAPFWGVRVPTPERLEFVELCGAFAKRMPQNAVFSHQTAARLIGLPLPFRAVDDSRLHVAVPPPSRAVRVVGAVGHQLRLAPQDTGVAARLPVTSPVRTWCDLGSILTVRELVVVGDFLISRRNPLATIGMLASAAETRRGRRGGPRLVAAVPLLNERTESPAESIVRTVLAQAGLPAMDVNVDFYAPPGCFLARPDIRFPEYRLIVEYEGDGHRTDRGQWRKDFRRTARLQLAGETVLRVGADHLADEALLIGDVSGLLRTLGWPG